MTALAGWSGVETSCPKCAHRDVTTSYREARGAVGYGGGTGTPEHMARACERCGHTWTEQLPQVIR